MDWAIGIFLAIFVNICECLECYDCVEGDGGVQDCEQTIDCPGGMDVCTLEWDGKSISILNTSASFNALGFNVIFHTFLVYRTSNKHTQ